MKDFTVVGIIGATSKKQTTTFGIQQNPRKSVYLYVDEKNKAILIEQGFTEYTSQNKDTGADESYFILKTAENVRVYADNRSPHPVSTLNGIGDLHIDKKSMSEDEIERIENINKENKNFSSNGKEVVMSIVQSEKNGNKYSRLSAILDGNGFVTENEQQNPF